MSRRIVITGARAPAALHLARLFAASGHHVTMADSLRFPLGRGSRMVARHVRLPPPARQFRAFADAMRRLVVETSADLVIPTCEEVFYLAAARDLLGFPLPLFAPDFALLSSVHNKYAFTGIATGCGADPPVTHLLQSRAEALAFRDRAGDMVFKPVWSRFASRILIRPDLRALEKLNPSPSDPWVAQDYLPGEEISAYAIARGGRMASFAAYLPLYRAGPGAAVGFGFVDVPDVRAFAAAFVARTGWTGQIAFDLRRDARGRFRVIECNPRATSGVHGFGVPDDVPDAFLDSEAGLSGKTRAPSTITPMMMPLAMLTYGLAEGLRTGRGASWLRDFRAMEDIMAFPGDRRAHMMQVLSLLELCGISLRHRIPLRDAATRDIAWNGQHPLS